MQSRRASSRAVDAALDDVAAQLQTMRPDEIVDQEDLAWSLPNGVYVEPEVLSIEPLVVRLEASKGIWPNRIVATRTLSTQFPVVLATLRRAVLQRFARASCPGRVPRELVNGVRHQRR